ncbi:hypothetical protein DPEC_G00354670 [Dallia pectoralis]|uniref:Uncharacterized protein n=1 Tax=Dallia pectoralis TaxID=75939 RepID=A0ACC2EZ97_DALPE|nr:hypothetical protein DPEC_G00354670 [Dallia pectoralis]
MPVIVRVIVPVIAPVLVPESMDHLKRFKAAVDVIQNLPKNGSYRPSYEVMLRFYSLYKQAVCGPCTVSRPGFWDPVGRYKWDAWNRLGDMNRESAMATYVEEIKKVAQEVIDTFPMNEKTASLFHYFEPLYVVIDDMPRPPNTLIGLTDMKCTKEAASLVVIKQKTGTQNELLPNKEMEMVPAQREEPAMEMVPAQREEPAIEMVPAQREEPAMEMVPAQREEPAMEMVPAQREEPAMEMVPAHREEPATEKNLSGEEPAMKMVPAQIEEHAMQMVLARREEPETRPELIPYDGTMSPEVQVLTSDTESEIFMDSVESVELQQNIQVVQILHNAHEYSGSSSIPANHMETGFEYSGSSSIPANHMETGFAATQLGSGKGGEGAGNIRGTPMRRSGGRDGRRNHTWRRRGVPQGRPRQPERESLGSGAGRVEGDGSENVSERLQDIQVQEEILLALQRLREDMESVMKRLEAVEKLALTLHLDWRSCLHCAASVTQSEDTWWPFPDVSGRTMLLLLFWPIVAQSLVVLLRRGQNT